MKRATWPAWVPTLCLVLCPGSFFAQQNRLLGDGSAAFSASTDASSFPGRIAGIVRDSTGAVIEGAEVKLSSAGTFRAQTTTDRSGHFFFAGIPAGRYQLTVISPGFEPGSLDDIELGNSGDIHENITLRVASTRTSIEVKAPLLGSAAATLVEPGLGNRAATTASAEFLAETPGVTLRENGALGSIPILHGLADERTRIIVDGMNVSSTCPNHMNPPSSYMSPAQAGRMTVMPGITPVSLGGDSLGGTIAVDSTEPSFADSDKRVHSTMSSSGFYRSNGDYYGGSFTEWIAGRHLGFGYNGSWARNDNYADGSGHKITSSYAQSTDHNATMAVRGANNLVVLRGSLHHVPYEGFPSAQMDLVRDYSESLNLHYRRSLEHGAVDAHVYWQGTWHSMNAGKDKLTFPKPMWMPMNIHGRDYGYSWKLDLPIAARHNLTAGNEVHRLVLDDRWQAVPGKAPGMGPDTFLNINNGRRMRMGWFTELTSQWNAKWTTLFGIRTDTVWMNTDAVHGYSGMYAGDAGAFNAANRKFRNNGVDATAWMRYEPNPAVSFKFGYARKNRAPNLYERYAWSTSKMISGMIGWFGDGNYYVGNLALRPETADTIGGTVSSHDSGRARWDVKVSPYVTTMHDFIDVDPVQTYKAAKATQAQLRFANHDARIAGVDLSGAGTLWQSGVFGYGRINLLAGWQHGERTDTSTPLYQMAPVHARIAFEEQKNGFSGAFGVDVFDKKARLDPNRLEQRTPGYALLDWRAGYQRGHLIVSAGADNLLNRYYALPLGGVNMDDFMASGRSTELRPLTGRGRSGYLTLSAQF
jgi:iron complex outermembrane receptor protein